MTIRQQIEQQSPSHRDAIREARDWIFRARRLRVQQPWPIFHGGAAHACLDVAREYRLWAATHRKTTDFWPAGREKEAAAYNRQYGPR